MSQGPHLVLQWLSELHLAHYVEAFLDNGYDDLEVCKQIGQPDLDAIGVGVEGHRLRLLGAVQRLKDEEKKKVAPGFYFTLEPSAGHLGTLQGSGRPHRPSCPGNQDLRLTDCKDFVTYPKLKLKVLIRDKLAKDGIDLGEDPYTRQDGSVGNLDDLALEYSGHYSTSLAEVSARMEELRRRRVVQEVAETANLDSATTSVHLRSHIQESLGLCTPDTDRKLHKVKCESDSASAGKWKSFWPSVRRSQRGATPHISKGDFLASEITMSDEERIQLMMMVKENMISIEEALARLKEFEVQNKQTCRSEPTECTQTSDKSPCELSDGEEEEGMTFRRLHKMVSSTRKVKKKLIRMEEARRTSREESQSGDVGVWKKPFSHVDSLTSALQDNLNCEAVTWRPPSAPLHHHHHHHQEEEEAEHTSDVGQETKMARSATDGELRRRLLGSLGHPVRACSFGGFDLTERVAQEVSSHNKVKEAARSPQMSAASLGRKVKSVRDTMRRHITRRYQASPDGVHSCPHSPRSDSLEKKPGGSVESLRSSLSSMSTTHIVSTRDWVPLTPEPIRRSDGEHHRLVQQQPRERQVGGRRGGRAAVPRSVLRPRSRPHRLHAQPVRRRRPQAEERRRHRRDQHAARGHVDGLAQGPGGHLQVHLRGRPPPGARQAQEDAAAQEGPAAQGLVRGGAAGARPSQRAPPHLPVQRLRRPGHLQAAGGGGLGRAAHQGPSTPGGAAHRRGAAAGVRRQQRPRARQPGEGGGGGHARPGGRFPARLGMLRKRRQPRPR
ncbi:SAM and SH3 domain-containing protein 1-like isoform X3 [Entelurus aequoreus]|uniref:SAM and SH3 domain-containing protein 1-like isoform X3 n=1 Tax=Entelurus aequoreus TaxID=161455 RepID=UPI002B1DFB4D|nr:SAM and SH3 domain-containing protein 1-like isoform X3 [Entelurus aequoreus]